MGLFVKLQQVVGFGGHKADVDPDASIEVREQHALWMLLRAMSMRTAIAFVGNSLSRAIGYPPWMEFAKMAITKASAMAKDESSRERFEYDLSTLNARERGGNLPVSDILSRLTRAKRIIRNLNDPNSSWHDVLRTCLHGPKERPRENPYTALVALPIRRFVTTNYDQEIELAFGPKKPISLTQRSNPSDLMTFATARGLDAKPPPSVFHCHGSLADMESLVVGEDDYQKWYLGEETGLFEDTLNLVLTSNPIIFIGFNLSEPDLVRTLRRFHFREGNSTSEQPMFALLDRGDGIDGQRAYMDRCDELHQTYGVQTLSFARKEDWGQAWREALDDLHAAYSHWRWRWKEKPQMRAFGGVPRPPDPYLHHELHQRRGFQADNHFEVRTGNVTLLHKRLSAERPRVVVLVGRGGAGKSWLATKLLRSFDNKPDSYDGRFFWSSYYSDDAVSGVDRALAYLDPRTEQKGGRFQRLRACLEKQRYLVVVDGLERLLSEAQPGTGKAQNDPARRFLEAIASPKSLSTVILTSRLTPTEIEVDIKHPVEPVTTQELLNVGVFRLIDRERVDALCQLLSGHAYGLALLHEWLRLGDLPQLRDSHDRLNHHARWLESELLYANRDSRLTILLRIILDGLNSQPAHAGAVELLHHLANLISPTAATTIVQYAVAAKIGTTANVRGWLQILTDHALIIEVGTDSTAETQGEPLFCTHPTVREYLFSKSGGALADVLPNFTLPSFTSGRKVVHPGGDISPELVRNMVKTLLGMAEQSAASNNYASCRRALRAAFGVIRARMEANGVPRWTSYDEFVILLSRLVNQCKHVSTALWTAATMDSGAVYAEDAVFYPEELGWLYYQIAIAYYSEGSTHDTLACFEQAEEIAQKVDRDPDRGPFTVLTRIHLALAFIDRGWLRRARTCVDDARISGDHMEDGDIRAQIHACEAKLSWYRDELELARAGFEEALRLVEVPGRTDMRAVAKWHVDLAWVLLRLGEIDSAERSIRIAKSNARSGQFPDLLAWTHVAQGDLERIRGRIGDSIELYGQADKTFQKVGIRRGQCEVLLRRGLSYLSLGDAEIARKSAFAALCLSNRLVLQLLQTEVLDVLGRSMVYIGDMELGKAYLGLAKRRAEQEEHMKLVNDLESFQAYRCIHKHGKKGE